MTEFTFLSGSVPDSLTSILQKQDIDEIVLSRSLVTREKQYGNIQNAVSSSGRPIRVMESVLTLGDLNYVDRFETQKTFLVFGGGRLIDFMKLVCAEKDCDLVVSPLFLSNDGFASGCSSLPSGEGSYVTLSSKIPLQVYGIYSILKKMPFEFVMSGLGELISKFNVIEDLKLDDSVTKKDQIMIGSMLDNLFEFLSSGFTKPHFYQADFLKGLAHSLFQFSLLMSKGSELCSRSEHEFEKACVMAGVKMRHGILVLCGTLVSMKLRENARGYQRMLKLIHRLDLMEELKYYFRFLISHLEKDEFKSSLQGLSKLRENRMGLWNYIDSSQVRWDNLFKEIYSDLCCTY
ncbi:Glycerol-1-phosphate dehydrogenase [Beggiatoa sp. PS]|nr:Glycerol-1-phosphate dehydrogenase [Beggiatoa sp. PS]